MNKKDCENIGMILASMKAPEYLLEEFYRLDARIKPEYEAFMAQDGRREDVETLTTTLLEQQYGPKWALTKACGKANMREAREQARKKFTVTITIRRYSDNEFSSAPWRWSGC